MEKKDILALYEEVALLSGKMLTAAHQSDWDRLTALEAGCASCMEKLKGCTTEEKLTAEARQHKIALIKTILANDREIRHLTEPWMQKLSALLGSASAECKLARVYRNAAD